MNKKLVIIGSVWPEPQSTAAGSRMLQLISLFRGMGFSISFLCTSQRTEYSSNLDSWDIEEIAIDLNSETFDKLIHIIDPSIVMFDRFMIEEQFGWRVIENCPNAIRILDTEDLHFLRKARQISYNQSRTLKYEDYINEIFLREMASIYRCDLSIIISEYEYSLLTETFAVDKSILFYLPFIVDSEVKSSNVTFETRQNFISIGNFLHEPNWQTVLILNKLWPSIKTELPMAELHIYGAYTPPKAYQLHNEKQGFVIKGRAENVRDVMTQYRVLLSPIPFGAGLKGKLLESMLYGLPNVTTAIGAEGMTYDDIWNGSICELPDFAKQSVNLYSHQEMWNKAPKNGYIILKNKFSKDLFANNFAESLDYLMSNLTKHRLQHFLGQILLQEAFMSKKYMSKWIEEKNKG